MVENAILPRRSTTEAGAYDLYALEACSIGPYNGTRRIRTGIKCNIPIGYCGQIWCRSGLGTKGLVIQAGFIDSDYRDMEIGVIVDSLHDQLEFEAGDRVGQIAIIACYYDVTYDSINGVGGKRVGGLGSTGK